MATLLTLENEGDVVVVDLLESEKAAMNYEFTDPGELVTAGSYSQQFRIPATDRNVAFFGDLANVNTVSSFSFHKKVKATLTVDTIPVAVGHVQVIRVFKKGDSYHELEINFFAETPDITREIGSKKLSELDYSDLAHDMTFDNVINGDASGNWHYALTDRGYKWSEQGEVGTREVLNTANPIYPAEMTLHIREFWLFNKIIREAGFTYELNGIQSEMEDVYIPFCNSKFNRSTNQPAQFLFSAYLTSNTSIAAGIDLITLSGFTETLDANGDFNATTGVYTAPFTGWFTFRVWATNDPTATSGIPSNYRRIGIVDSTTNDVLYDQLSAPSAGTITKNMQSNDVVLFLEQGQQLKMGVRNQAAGTSLGGTPDFATGTGWALVNTSDSLAGATIDIGANAPNITQYDFLKDVIKKYNLVFIPDRRIPKKIYLEPFSSYIGSGDTLDWSKKLDQNFDIEIAPTSAMQKKNLLFTYSKGNDAASELFNKEGKRIYGDYKIQGFTTSPTDHPNDFAEGDLSVSLTAQSTPCNTIAGTSIVIPKFVDASGEFVDPALRYLYLNGNAEVALYDEGITSGVMAQVRLSGHYSEQNPTISDRDLNFAPETPLHLIEANPFNNLFNRWWRPYLNEIYSPEARVVTCNMILNVNDVVSFKFSDRIWIVDAWYRLLKINGYAMATEMSVSCTFMKLIDSQLDCSSTPYQIGTGGIVQFQEPDESITFGTEDCCNRYGYNWSADTSRCYAFGDGGTGRPDRPNGITTEITGGNMGLSFDGSNTATRYTMRMVNKSSISPSAVFSYLGGSDITIGQGNPHTLAVGEKVELKENVRGAALVGKNVRAVHGGFHLGGGWNGGDYSKVIGQSQSGTIMYIGEGSFTDTTTEIPILIEGLDHLNIDDGACLNCVMNVSVMKWNAASGAIDDSRVATFQFIARKVLGESKASTITSINQVGGLHALDLVIDTDTDTDEQRISVKMGGSGHPHTNIKIAASLNYTQIKHA